jgi:hypothetical protein
MVSVVSSSAFLYSYSCHRYLPIWVSLQSVRPLLANLSRAIKNPSEALLGGVNRVLASELAHSSHNPLRLVVRVVMVVVVRESFGAITNYKRLLESNFKSL